MEFTGKIITICAIKSGISKKTNREWKSQEFVIQSDGEYPQTLIFSVFGEDKLNQYNIQVGEKYTITLNFDGREYKGRWFNSINAVNVVKVLDANVEVNKGDNSSDDLPF